MTKNEYISKLDSIHKANMEMFNEATSNKTMAEDFNSAIALYESFIPEFFSKNGSADGIRAIYKELREDYFDASTIECVDTSNAVAVYKEYSEGMQKFVNDIISAYNTGNLRLIEENKNNLEKARKNDSIFIESVFEGKRIKETMKQERTLKEAVQNIESLIDFVPHLSDLKKTCIEITESVSSISDVDDSIVRASLQLLYESVDTYCHSMIKTVMETYSEINDAINPKKTGNLNSTHAKKFILL